MKVKTSRLAACVLILFLVGGGLVYFWYLQKKIPVNQEKIVSDFADITPVVYGCATPEASLAEWRDCDKLREKDTVCLLDERDGKTYQVRKFADGKCWYINDLRYGGTNDACQGRQEFSGLMSGESGRFGATSLGDCRESDTVGAGYFYNFAAAVQTTTGENAQGLCPAGWHVPDRSEFVTLGGQAGGPSFWTDDWQASLAGDAIFSGELFGQGLFGYYWSATTADAKKAYNLQLSPGKVDTESVHDQTIGFLLRCVHD